jgi:hypothetical protein
VLRPPLSAANVRAPLDEGEKALMRAQNRAEAPIRTPALGTTARKTYSAGGVEVIQPRSVAFCTSFGLGPSGRFSVCLAIAFKSPLQPAPALGAANAGKAIATIIAAITTATVSTRRILLTIPSPPLTAFGNPATSPASTGP